jgi:hypothetical protein
MSEAKSAKTLGADARRPFSDRTARRLVRMGEADEGRTDLSCEARSEAERVGFSGR